MEYSPKRFGLLLVSLLILSIFTSSITPVRAEAHTIVVPDNYPTIESALGSAANGDLIFIRNGTYDGPINQTLSVHKSVTLMGESRESTIIRLFAAYNETWLFATCLPTYTDALIIEGDNCGIFNLTVEPRGYISVVGDNVQVVGNNFSSGQSMGLSVSGSKCKIVDNIYDGYLSLNGSDGYIAGNSGLSVNIQGSSNIIKNNDCQFISLTNATNNVVASNILSSDLGYCGISIDHSSNNVFVRNSITWYTFGFGLWEASGNLIAANTIANCHRSVAVGASSNNRFYLNNFVDNEPWSTYVYDQYTDPPLRDANPSITASTNLWDNGAVGNYWQNYTGTDANGDGIFDAPYLFTNVFYVSVGSEGSVLVVGQDNYPLASRVDVAGAKVELADWATSLLKLPEPAIVEPSIEPQLSPSSVTQGPQTNQEQPQGQTFLVGMLIAVAVGIAVIFLAFLLYKKKASSV
jgi:nitrous oxidase accessory protein